MVSVNGKSLLPLIEACDRARQATLSKGRGVARHRRGHYRRRNLLTVHTANGVYAAIATPMQTRERRNDWADFWKQEEHRVWRNEVDLENALMYADEMCEPSDDAVLRHYTNVEQDDDNELPF